jgi:hypothetical protein
MSVKTEGVRARAAAGTVEADGKITLYEIRFEEAVVDGPTLNYDSCNPKVDEFATKANRPPTEKPCPMTTKAPDE